MRFLYVNRLVSACVLILLAVAPATGQDKVPAGRLLVQVGLPWLNHNEIALSPDGKYLAATGSTSWLKNRREMKLFDAATGRELRSFDLKGQGALHPVFSPDGKRIAAADTGKLGRSATVWDTATARELLVLEHKDYVGHLAFSPDGKRIATGTGYNAGMGPPPVVKLWDAATCKALLTLKGHESPISRVAFSPDGKRLYSSCWNTLRVWDAATGKALLTVTSRPSFGEIALSPDGRLVASTSEESTRIWDAVTGKELLRLKVPFEPFGGLDPARSGVPVASRKGHLRGIAFSPDGKLLAGAAWNASNKQSIRVWEVATGKPVHVLWGQEGSIGNVVFSPGGTCLFSGSSESIWTWKLK